MSKFTIGIAAIVIATAFSTAIYAAPPEKEAPQRAAPQRATAPRAAPQRAAVQRAAPQRLAPQRAVTPRAAPQRLVPQRAASQRAAPHVAAAPSGMRNTSRTATFNTKLNSTVKANAVRETLNSRSVAGALHNRSALRNPISLPLVQGVRCGVVEGQYSSSSMVVVLGY